MNESGAIGTSQAWTGGSNAVSGHTCNCIGCCERCGMCRTNPLHNALTCRRVAVWRSQNPLLLANGMGA